MDSIIQNDYITHYGLFLFIMDNFTTYAHITLWSHFDNYGPILFIIENIIQN